jgi:hypothetical protein
LIPCLLVLVSCLYVSCDEQGIPNIDDLMTSENTEETAGEGLQIIDYEYSDDYKGMELSAQLMSDIGGYDLTDSLTVAVRPLQEFQILPGQYGDETQPLIKSVRNVSREALQKMNIKLLVLVDLSLPQQEIDAECRAVKEIRTLFGENSLYVAFMEGENVTETYEATDYVVDHYFVHHDPSTIYLYRSVLTKLAEFQDTTMTLGSAQYKVMVIMSGGKTYEGDLPVDPMHFELQQILTDKAQQLKGSLLRVYYGNFKASSQTADMDILSMPLQTSGDSNILHYFCKDMGGIYQTAFKWNEIEADILKDFHIELSRYKIKLEHPDGKVFRGNLHRLQIGFYDRKTGDLITKGTTSYSLGTVYNPIIIRDNSRIDVLIAGLLTTLFVLLLVWVVMQFLEPFIRYRVFKYKHVSVYSGGKMSINGTLVAEQCYLCKAPFETGDEIVTKCKHTMHKSCWDENEYHCPEYGRHCKEGSHYYNANNLLDSRNALFYLKWVMVAIIAGFVAWLVFTSERKPLSASVIQYVSTMLSDQKSGTVGAHDYFMEYGSHLSDLPGFGQVVGFLLTFFLSLFTVRRRQWFLRISEVLLRALIASVLGMLCCVLGCIIFIVLHLESNTFLIDWIPWALLSCVIMMCVTVKTRTPIRRSFFLMACVIAVLSMGMWAVIYFNSFIDYRQMLLFGFIAYSVAIAVCIARVTPKSERYFLHIEGAVKEMDIALYKWFRTDPNHVVSIGKSVDCSIQLSWDLIGQVAPVHAEIKRHIDSLRLEALDEGVLIGDKPLRVGKEVWLYHGRKFTVGNTTFTYIEKDL